MSSKLESKGVTVLFNLEILKQASETDRQIANYIANNQESVAFMRVRELAEKTHVSPATIVRFIQKMGYSSFPELRLSLKQHLEVREHSLQTTQDKIYLEETHFPVNFDEKLDQLIEIIDQASFIHCLGTGSSNIMAQYAQQRFSSLGYRSIASVSAFIPYLSTKNEVKTETIDEVCLLFSVSGETPDMIHLARELAKTSVYSVSITNKESNTLTGLCDFSLTYDTPSNRHSYSMDMTSQLPVVYIIEALAKRLYLKNYPASNK